MKKSLFLTIVFAITIVAGNVIATDFGQNSMEELANMRGPMWNATEQEREAFRAEWQKRIQNMNQEERQKYTGKPENAMEGKMMKQRQKIQERNTMQNRNFSQYSTEELANMRGTMWNATEQKREAFRAEWQKRIQNMNQEERQKYMGRPENAGQGKMMKQREMIQERDSMQERGYGSGMSGGKGRGRK